MAEITIATGEIPNYTGDETAPLLRYFLDRTIIASSGDVLPSGNPEEGEFFKEVTCSVAGTTITYPSHTIDSTLDATPNKGKVTIALFTAAGVLIQPLLNGVKIPETPTSTTLEDILTSQSTITPVPDSAYSQAQSDARYLKRSGLGTFTVGAAQPSDPIVGDVWIDTDN